MKFIIITGLSGAGKSQVVKSLEDIGFYCVDKIPPQFIKKFAEIYHRSSGPLVNAALVCDMRGGDMFGELSNSLEELAEMGYEYEILFLNASDETLIKRYKETRRMHPLSFGGRIIDGIQKERKLLDSALKTATHVIDTSMLTNAQLQKHIKTIYSSSEEFEGLVINVMSFGFKYGLPLDADLVFDVRFLPNPFYIAELKEHTGLETCVHDYVMKFEQSQEFLKKLTDMVDYLIPHYIKEGKSQLVIAVGCTGGHHRSVTIAEELYKYLNDQGHHAMITHRDIKKGV